MENSYQEKQLGYAEKIRESYGEHTESDLEKLRKLDEKVKRPADIFAYTFGVVGALVLGVGMCIAMGTIGAESLFPLGVVVGVIGIGRRRGQLLYIPRHFKEPQKEVFCRNNRAVR